MNKETITIDFYLYGVLDKITAILDIVGIEYSVEKTSGYVINYKRLTIPDDATTKDLITNIMEIVND